MTKKSVKKSKKLTEKQVKKARDMYASGKWTQPNLAKHFGVSLSKMRQVLRGVEKKKQTFEQKLWSYIDRRGENECWNYTKGLDRDGYGHFYFDGKTYRAHRAVYKVSKGPIPKGYYVCHTCDNPTCCNPEHLIIGTPKENMRQMAERGRSKKPSLTSKDRLVIQQLVKRSELPQRLVGEQYGIMGTTARDIARKDPLEYMLSVWEQMALQDLEQAKLEGKPTDEYEKLLDVLHDARTHVQSCCFKRKVAK
jgi:hypothetical protein